MSGVVEGVEAWADDMTVEVVAVVEAEDADPTDEMVAMED